MALDYCSVGGHGHGVRCSRLACAGPHRLTFPGGSRVSGAYGAVLLPGAGLRRRRRPRGQARIHAMDHTRWRAHRRADRAPAFPGIRACLADNRPYRSHGLRVGVHTHTQAGVHLRHSRSRVRTQRHVPDSPEQSVGRSVGRSRRRGDNRDRGHRLPVPRNRNQLRGVSGDTDVDTRSRAGRSKDAAVGAPEPQGIHRDHQHEPHPADADDPGGNHRDIRLYSPEPAASVRKGRAWGRLCGSWNNELVPPGWRNHRADSARQSERLQAQGMDDLHHRRNFRAWRDGVQPRWRVYLLCSCTRADQRQRGSGGYPIQDPHAGGRSQRAAGTSDGVVGAQHRSRARRTHGSRRARRCVRGDPSSPDQRYRAPGSQYRHRPGPSQNQAPCLN